MKKVIRLTESDLVRLVKRVINESDNKDQYYIVAYPDHLRGKGMCIYTGGDGFSIIPTSIEFRRKMHLEMDNPPKSYDSLEEAMKDLKKVKRETKNRPDISWEIVKWG
jgi:hypothetical protein